MPHNELHSAYPRLPPELEHEIFALAAQSCPKCVPNLMLVCQRALLWTEPFLYNSVQLAKETDIQRRFFSAERPKPLTFFARAVREVIVLEWCDSVRPALALCSGATHVAISPGLRMQDDRPAHAEIVPLLVLMPLQRLCAYLDPYIPQMFASDAPVPAFAHTLTHLDLLIHASSDGPTPEELRHFLASLSSLTHLSLSYVPEWILVDAILADCASLRVFVVMFAEEDAGVGQAVAELVPLRDARFALGTYVEWWDGARLDGALGYEVYWDVAERFICAKQAKEIAEDCFWFGEPVLED